MHLIVSQRSKSINFERFKDVAIPKFELSAWFYLGIPTFLAFVVILGSGPYLQQTIGSVLSRPGPTLYAAAFGEGLIDAPSFWNWLIVGFELPLVVPALITTLVALSAPTYRLGAFRAAMAAFVTISVSDTVWYFLDPEKMDLWQAIPFNALGALFIWLFFSSLFLIYERCKTSWREYLDPKVSYPLLAVTFAVALSLVIFVPFQLFFNPTSSAEFRAIANFPTSGFMVTDTRNAGADESRKRGLSAFPENSKAERFEFTGFADEAEARWEQLDDNAKFLIRISAYADCPLPQDLETLPKPKPFLELRPRTVEVRMSEGQSRIVTAHEGTREYNLTPTSVFQYWLKADNSGRLSGIEAFIEPRDKVSVNPSGGLKFFLGGALSDYTDSTARAASRRITLSIDGQEYLIDAGGNRKVGNQRLNCAALSGVQQSPSGEVVQVTIPNGGDYFSIGLLVEVTEEPVELDTYTLDQSNLTFTRLNGWAKLQDIDVERTLGSYLGDGRGISIVQNLESLVIDGEEVAVRPRDDLFIVADTIVSYEPTYLEVRGTATAIWLNNRRLNATLWERLGEGWQIAIITAIAGLLGLLISKSVPLFLNFIREDKSLET